MKIYNKRYALAILAFFLLSYILPLGGRELMEPDETRYGEIPREMIAGGDWVVPHLNGVRYFEKPVLGYWVHAGSLLLFGENDFAVRLPSAMALGLTALCLFFAIRRARRKEAGEDGLAPVLAVLVYMSCFEVFGVGNTAVLDNLFSFFVSACVAAFFFATEALPGTVKEKGFLLLFGLFCGLGFLTKGFLAFALPILALVPYLLWQRRYADLFRMSWLPILVAVATILPWGIAIHHREPDFWRFFFWNEHIRRFLADNAQHKSSFWFYFIASPGMFMPWTLLVPAAAVGIKDRINESGRRGRLMRLSLCWLVLPLIFFSISNGKLLTYILPCFPPFAILVAFGLLRLLEKNEKSRLFQAGVAANAAFFGLILIAFLYIQTFGLHGVRPFSQPWKVMLAIDGIAFFLLFCLWTLKSRRGKEKVLVFGMAPLLFFFVLHFVVPDPTSEAKSPGPLLEKYKSGIDDQDIVLSDNDSIRAVCWYLRRNDVYVIDRAGELAYGLGWKDADGRLLGKQSVADLIRKNQGKTVLIARNKSISRWRDWLPSPPFQAQSGPSGYVLWKY